MTQHINIMYFSYAQSLKEATSAASQTVNEVCQEAMSCYEKDLIEMQVNVHSALDTNAKIIASWKEL